MGTRAAARFLHVGRSLDRLAIAAPDGLAAASPPAGLSSACWFRGRRTVAESLAAGAGSSRRLGASHPRAARGVPDGSGACPTDRLARIAG